MDEVRRPCRPIPPGWFIYTDQWVCRQGKMIRAAGDPAQRFLATMRAVQAGLRCGSGAMCGRRQRLLTASGAGIAFDVGVLLVQGAIATDAIPGIGRALCRERGCMYVLLSW